MLVPYFCIFKLCLQYLSMFLVLEQFRTSIECTSEHVFEVAPQQKILRNNYAKFHCFPILFFIAFQFPQKTSVNIFQYLSISNKIDYFYINILYLFLKCNVMIIVCDKNVFLITWHVHSFTCGQLTKEHRSFLTLQSEG